MSTSGPGSKGNRTVANLIKTTSINNPDQYIHHRQLEVEQWRNYWKNRALDL